jgi:hypothetical protein
MRLANLKALNYRVLVFDIECRPTAWFGGDFVGKSITAAAWLWLDNVDEVFSSAITMADINAESVVRPLVDAIEDADMVVGHFVRGFDLPVLSGDIERLGWEPLSPVLTHDTKLDRKQTMGISESLENLSARYELVNEKMSMHEPWWEQFNLWQTPESRRLVLARVEQDIRGTAELYQRMLEEGRMKSPKVWSPDQSKMPRYRS